MEEKCLKAPIYTVETVFKDSAEVPVDIEFNMPDYCPEISRILKCRAVARIASKSVSDRTVSADGSVTATVIYADSEGAVNSYEYQFPFSKIFESGVDLTGAQVSVKARCEYVNCRAVTGRKIDIHGAVGVFVTASRRKSRNIISGIEGGDIELLRERIPAAMPVAAGDKYIILEEEIETGNSQPDVSCLISYDADVRLGECKLLAGKVMVKGEISVFLLYRGEQSEPQQVTAVIPFSQLLEIDDADENCICEAWADIAYLEIKPKFNSSGLSRSFSMDGKLLLSVKLQCGGEIDIVTDAYSRSFEASIQSEEICFEKAVCSPSDTFNCRREIDLGAEISRVYDIRCEVSDTSVAFDEDCLMITGTAAANIIALDTAGAPVFIEKPVDFEYRFKMPYGSGDFKCDPQIGIKSVNYTLLSEDRMEIRLEMTVRATVYECTSVSVITDIKTDSTRRAQKRRAAMTVYFAEAGESLWDISRKYLASVEEVKSINGITDDKLSGRQMILLPAD